MQIGKYKKQLEDAKDELKTANEKLTACAGASIMTRPANQRAKPET